LCQRAGTYWASSLYTYKYIVPLMRTFMCSPKRSTLHRPLRTNTVARQGSDKREKKRGETWVMVSVTASDAKHKAIMVDVVMAINPNHRPSWEQRGHACVLNRSSLNGRAWSCILLRNYHNVHTSAYYLGTITNSTAWTVNRFYLMVRRSDIKCVHQPQPLLLALRCG